jgi:hypothetical protein
VLPWCLTMKHVRAGTKRVLSAVAPLSTFEVIRSRPHIFMAFIHAAAGRHGGRDRVLSQIFA